MTKYDLVIVAEQRTPPVLHRVACTQGKSQCQVGGCGLPGAHKHFLYDLDGPGHEKLVCPLSSPHAGTPWRSPALSQRRTENPGKLCSTSASHIPSCSHVSVIPRNSALLFIA